MAVGDWWALLVLHPPFGEGSIQSDVEPLFWWRSFRESVTHVSAKYNKVLCGSNGIEQMRACLVNAVCVRLVKDLHGAGESRAVADAACLFTAVQGFNTIGPDEMEDCSVVVDGDGLAEHMLLVILV